MLLVFIYKYDILKSNTFQPVSRSVTVELRSSITFQLKSYEAHCCFNVRALYHIFSTSNKFEVY